MYAITELPVKMLHELMSIGILDTDTAVSLLLALHGSASHQIRPKRAVFIQNPETQDYRAAHWGAVLVSPPIIPSLKATFDPTTTRTVSPLATRSLMPSCFETY